MNIQLVKQIYAPHMRSLTLISSRKFSISTLPSEGCSRDVEKSVVTVWRSVKIKGDFDPTSHDALIELSRVSCSCRVVSTWPVSFYKLGLPVLESRFLSTTFFTDLLSDEIGEEVSSALGCSAVFFLLKNLLTCLSFLS